MTIGARELLNQYGTPLQVAKALLQNKLSGLSQQYATEIIGPTMLEAARISLQSDDLAKTFIISALIELLMEKGYSEEGVFFEVSQATKFPDEDIKKIFLESLEVISEKT